MIDEATPVTPARQYLVYDCEIIAAIPSRNEAPIAGISYFGGWRDFEHMGISVIGAYDYLEDRYRVFCQDNFPEFQALIKERTIVRFNGLAFDDPLCVITGFDIQTEYDLLVEIWRAAGLGPQFVPETHGGYGLDACCEFNGLGRKSGSGTLAPVLWQQGHRGAVIDYCLQDVRLEKRLFDLVLTRGSITCPKTQTTLTMRRPVCA